MKNVFLSVCALFLLAAAGGCCDKKISSPEQGALLIDVRSPQEFQEGALKGAINLPHDRIGEMIETVAPDRNTPLYLYCRSGRRVEAARESLKKLDYKKTYNLGGLTQAAETLKLPVEK